MRWVQFRCRARGPLDGPEVVGKGMAAVDPRQEGIVHGLEPGFDADVWVTGEFVQEDNASPKGVGPGADGDPNHLRMVEGAAEEIVRRWRGDIGIGVFLEIDDELLAAEPFAVIGHTRGHLHLERDTGWVPGGEKTGVVAVDAAADPLVPVAVRAGEAGVHVDLADPAAEAPAQTGPVGVERRSGLMDEESGMVIRPALSSEGGRRIRRLRASGQPGWPRSGAIPVDAGCQGPPARHSRFIPPRAKTGIGEAGTSPKVLQAQPAHRRPPLTG